MPSEPVAVPPADTTPPATPAPSAPAATPPATPPAVPPATPPSGEQPPATPPAEKPPGNEPPATPPAEFKVPDEYKDKPWAAKVKNESDLWKQLENLNVAVGKKVVAPDLETATPKQIEEYYAQTRPESKDAYVVPEGVAPEYREAVTEILHKHGISKKQGSDIIADYLAAEKSKDAVHFEQGAFEKQLETSFGADWKNTAGQTAAAIAKNLSPEDKALFDAMPNEVLGVFYRLTNNLVAGYGIEDGGHAATGPAGAATYNDLEGQAGTLFKQIQDMSSRPHTAEEKQNLINQRDAIFQRMAKMKK